MPVNKFGVGRSPLHLFKQIPTFESLRFKEWRILWMGGHIWYMGFWMEFLILGWIVLEWTDSPFLVAMVGTFRFLPTGIVGFLAGSQADRLPKKHLLVSAQILNFVVTVAFTIILGLGLANVWHVLIAALLTGIARAIDFPVRRALIRDLLPEKSIVNAMALDIASLIGMTMVGRWLAGGLLAVVGAFGAYVYLTTGYIIALALLLRVSNKPVHRSKGAVESPLMVEIREGLIFAWNNLPLRGVLLITVVVNLLIFPYILLLPVFARDVFSVGPDIMGLMGGMDGFGVLVGTIVLASIGTVKQRGVIFLSGSTLMVIAVSLFSLTGSYIVALPILAIAGVGHAGFSTLQMAIPVSTSSPRMRGRALGAVMLAAGFFPVGTFLLGMLAQIWGASTAVLLCSLTGVVLIQAITIAQPGLRKF